MWNLFSGPNPNSRMDFELFPLVLLFPFETSSGLGFSRPFGCFGFFGVLGGFLSDRDSRVLSLCVRRALAGGCIKRLQAESSCASPLFF